MNATELQKLMDDCEAISAQVAAVEHAMQGCVYITTQTTTEVRPIPKGTPCAVCQRPHP